MKRQHQSGHLFLKMLSPIKVHYPHELQNLNFPYLLQICFLILSLFVFVSMLKTEQLKTLALTFGAIILEAFPFVALGALVSGILEVFVAQEKIARWFPQGKWLPIFLGAGLGIIFPVCECAIVLVVRRLLHKGIPLGAAVAFLLGGPIVNPVVAVSTAVAYQFNWKIAILRLACGYSIAVVAGFLLDFLLIKKAMILPEQKKRCYHTSRDSYRDRAQTLFTKLRWVMSHAAADFYDIGRFFIVGAFLAALVQTFAARQTITAYLLGSPITAIMGMMILAIILNLCSEADAFVAASFQSMLVPLTGQMAFMVLGPMLDLKLLVMYLEVFRKQAIVTLASLTFLLVFSIMLILELLI